MDAETAERQAADRIATGSQDTALRVLLETVRELRTALADAQGEVEKAKHVASKLMAAEEEAERQRSARWELEEKLTSHSAALAAAQWEVERLREELAKPCVNPMSRREPCPACGKLSRITTAGCDHCGLEDK